MPKLNHLRKRRGRYLVQMRVPKDIRHLFPNQNVDVYLGTGNHREAAHLLPNAVAKIRDRFAQQRSAILSSPDIEDAPQTSFSRMRRSHHEAADEFFEEDKECKISSDAVGALMELEDALEHAEGRSVAKEADRIVVEHGSVLSDDQRAESSQALLRARIAALDPVIALKTRGVAIERPAIFITRAVDPATWAGPERPTRRFSAQPTRGDRREPGPRQFSVNTARNIR